VDETRPVAEGLGGQGFSWGLHAVGGGETGVLAWWAWVVVACLAA
jgi:hypothetical protein